MPHPTQNKIGKPRKELAVNHSSTSLNLLLFCCSLLCNISSTSCQSFNDCSIHIPAADSLTVWNSKYGIDYVLNYVDSVNRIIDSSCGECVEKLINTSQLSKIYLRNGRLDNAIEVNLSTAYKFLELRDTARYVNGMFNLGNAYIWKGDNGRAFEILIKGYKDLRDYNIQNPQLEARFLSLIGRQYLSSDAKYARQCLRKAIEKCLTIGDIYYANISAINLATSYRTKNDPEAALKILNTHYPKIQHSENLVGKAALHREYAKLYADLKNIDRSMDHFRIAENAYKQASNDSLLSSIISYERAEVYLDNKQSQLALRHSNIGLLRLGIKNLKEAKIRYHPNLQYVLSTLKVRAKIIEKTLENTDDYNTRIHLDLIYSRTLETISLLLEGYEEKRGTQILSDNHWIYANAIDNCRVLTSIFNDPNFLRKGLWYSEYGKSQLLKLKINRSRISEQLPVSILKKKEALSNSLSELKLKIFKYKKSKNYKASEETIADAEEISAQLQAVVEEISSYSPSQVRTSCLDTPDDIQNIQQDIPTTGNCIIHVFSDSATWHAWYILKDSLIQRSYPIKWNERNETYSNCALAINEPNLGEDLCKLSDLGIKNLAIVGDASLAQCSFETIAICDKSAIALERFNISYQYSLCTTNPKPPTYNYEENLIAWAPNYPELTMSDSIDPLLTNLVRSGYYGLPGARSEVQQITTTINGKLIVDNEADKTSFIKNKGRARILHLSMHALHDPEDYNLSKFLFSGVDIQNSNSHLHAYEVENMNISAELAVLSACETGVGRTETGEGVMSLARAFAFAGVPSTIMSLWKVPDHSTAQIMVSFYQHLKDGKRKDVALKLAKLDYLNNTISLKQRDPYYWAGFVLVGDPSPIQFEKNGHSFSMVQRSVIIGMALFIGLFYIKKYNIHLL